MAWEARHGRPYFYRSVRRCGRVVKEYWGRGPEAALAAALDAGARAKKRAEAEAVRRLVDDSGAADAATAEAAEMTTRLFHAALASAGYRRHARGTWRKRRATMQAMQTVYLNGPPPVPEPIAGPEGLRELLGRASRGDESCLPQVRMLLDDNEEVCRRVGDAAAHAETAWATLVGGGDLLARESFKLEAERMAAELAGESPSPIERMLARQAALCSLEASYFAATCAGAAQSPQAQREFLHKRSDRAQAKFAAALKQLAVCRKLLPPPKAPAPPVPAPSPIPRRPARRRAVSRFTPR